jgi:hypothetical protein
VGGRRWGVESDTEVASATLGLLVEKKVFLMEEKTQGGEIEEERKGAAEMIKVAVSENDLLRDERGGEDLFTEEIASVPRVNDGEVLGRRVNEEITVGLEGADQVLVNGEIGVVEDDEAC